MRLDICKITSEQLRNALYGNGFSHVNELAAAIVAPPRQSFGIFVREHRPLSLQHRGADDVFRSDQLDLVTLPAQLVPDSISNFGVAFLQGGGEKSRLISADG